MLDDTLYSLRGSAARPSPSIHGPTAPCLRPTESPAKWLVDSVLARRHGGHPCVMLQSGVWRGSAAGKEGLGAIDLHVLNLF